MFSLLALSDTQIVASNEWMTDRDLEGSCR